MRPFSTSVSAREQMRMCLVVVTFWPGVPLHYAGGKNPGGRGISKQRL
jgi:hypothetical protein